MVGRNGSRAIRRAGILGTVIVVIFVATTVTAYTAAQGAVESRAGHQLRDFSPALLGTYRKVMNVERELDTHAKRYGVDPSLARAVCMFESGGNPHLTSSAGARGLFQVMPSTFRLMRVDTNIEAGIKYLGQLVKQLGTEDYALAAYNGGPGRVARRHPMPLESLQYVIGVGIYRSALRAYEPEVRKYASQLQVMRAVEGDTWWTIAERVRLPVVQLRLHNPFLAERPLRAGALIVYPAEPRTDLFASDAASVYRTRVGDNYIKFARAMGIAPEAMRRENGLWRLQPTMPGMVLTIPRASSSHLVSYTIGEQDTLARIASRFNSDPWSIVRDNYLWDEVLTAGDTLRIASKPAALPQRKPVIVHHVRRGDTLAGIARRYGTSVSALQAANQMGRRTTIRPGQRLKVGN